MRPTRVVLALLIVGQSVAFFFATALTLSYRVQYLGVAQFLGGFTPGDDYRRFVPLMETTPWWVHSLWVAASVLFLVSAWKLLRNRRPAFPSFAAAFVLGTVGNVISSSTQAYAVAFSFPAPNLTRDYLVPAVTVFMAMVAAADHSSKVFPSSK